MQKLTPTNSTPVTPPHWTERQPELIAYAGGPGHYPTYSYIDVLRGQVPPNAFQGKYVLVGAVASGLGDTFATPVSSGARLMPGVEVVAHILDSHLSGIRLKAAPAAANIAFNLLPVAVALLTLLFAGPLTALLASFGLGLGTLLMSMALMRWTGWHFAPAAALLGLVLAYPPCGAGAGSTLPPIFCARKWNICAAKACPCAIAHGHGAATSWKGASTRWKPPRANCGICTSL